MRGGLVLDDFQCTDAGALLAPGAQKETSVRGWPEQDGARGRQVSLGVQIFGDTDGVPEDGGFDVVARINVDAAHELYQFPGLGPVVAAGLSIVSPTRCSAMLIFPYFRYD